LTEKTEAIGGISITASHNPEMWNGLKFLNSEGVFLNKEENEKFWILFDSDDIDYSENPNNISKLERIDSVQVHIDSIINSGYFDITAISSYFQSKKYKVVVDAVNASGSQFVPKLLRELGCEVVELFTDNSGIFPHTPEPIKENLSQLSQAVLETKADLGIAVDPDADRLVIIDENGLPIGEEKTIAIAVKSVLENEKFNIDDFKKVVTVNLSTSGMIEKIASQYNVIVERSAVGEINVVDKMKANKSIVGGEGSGGVILPHIHYGRDSLVGIALLLELIYKLKVSISELSNSLPTLYVAKGKVEVSSNPYSIIDKLAEKYKDSDINTEDGIRIVLNENDWVHIRASNTEPIVRIITESNTELQSYKLFEQIETILLDYL
jgi:phosphomannomutase